jgi:hypothetical protein
MYGRGDPSVEKVVDTVEAPGRAAMFSIPDRRSRPDDVHEVSGTPRSGQGVTDIPLATPASSASAQRDRIDGRHLAKTLAVAIGLTGLFMTPQLLIHIPTGIIAPISAGYMTGGLMRVRGGEAVIIGLVLFLVVGLPVPLAYHLLGLFNHLPFVAIAVFSNVFATY